MKNSYLLSPGGSKGYGYSQKILKNEKNAHIMPFWTFSNTKYPQNRLKTKINKYFF